MIFGAARSSKSTLMEWLCKRYYESHYPDENDNQITKRMIDFITRKMVYSHDQNTNLFNEYREEPIGFDESHYSADARNSMTMGNIDITSKVDAFASHNNPTFFLIQNLGNLDQRIIERSNLVIVYDRGEALIFMPIHNFPLFKIDAFKRIRDNPWLIHDKVIGKYTLSRLPNFAGEMKFTPFCKPSDPRDKWIEVDLHGNKFDESANNRLIFDTYKAQKIRWQDKI